MSKQYWLMKSEPDTFSFQDLKDRPEQREPWDGVRNYQARNFMMVMFVGDGVLFIILIQASRNYWLSRGC